MPSNPVDEMRDVCRYCGAEAEQGMDNGAEIIWTCMAHEDDGTPVDPLMQARRRYNRAVSDHYANLYDDEEWADVPQSETYRKMRTLGEVFEQTIRADAIQQERSRYEGLLAAARRLPPITYVMDSLPPVIYVEESVAEGIIKAVRDIDRAALAPSTEVPDAERIEGGE